jgi:hypothetical protein
MPLLVNTSVTQIRNRHKHQPLGVIYHSFVLTLDRQHRWLSTSKVNRINYLLLLDVNQDATESVGTKTT